MNDMDMQEVFSTYGLMADAVRGALNRVVRPDEVVVVDYPTNAAFVVSETGVRSMQQVGGLVIDEAQRRLNRTIPESVLDDVLFHEVFSTPFIQAQAARTVYAPDDTGARGAVWHPWSLPKVSVPARKPGEDLWFTPPKGRLMHMAFGPGAHGMKYDVPDIKMPDMSAVMSWAREAITPEWHRLLDALEKTDVGSTPPIKLAYDLVAHHGGDPMDAGRHVVSVLRVVAAVKSARTYRDQVTAWMEQAGGLPQDEALQAARDLAEHPGQLVWLFALWLQELVGHMAEGSRPAEVLPGNVLDDAVAWLGVMLAPATVKMHQMQMSTVLTPQSAGRPPVAFGMTDEHGMFRPQPVRWEQAYGLGAALVAATFTLGQRPSGLPGKVPAIRLHTSLLEARQAEAQNMILAAYGGSRYLFQVRGFYSPHRRQVAARYVRR